MSVSADWQDEKHDIVFYNFEGAWTWDEMYRAYTKAIALEKSVPYRVDVILDLRRSKSIPANALLHVKNISDKQPENLGLTVVVTPNGFVRALYNAGVAFYKGIGHYFRVTPTMEEAAQMIAADRQAHENKPIGKLDTGTARAVNPHPSPVEREK